MIIAISITAVVLFASHFITYKVSYNKGYDDAVATLSIDSTVVVIDTFYVKADTVTKYEWLFVNVADVDSSKDALVYSTQLDTSIVMEDDTVATLKQDISFTEGIFKILSEIE
ncbi:MAG: hypothetical protein ACERKJ_11650, partial [Candidatus Dadabacteria bacterium]